MRAVVLAVLAACTEPPAAPPAAAPPPRIAPRPRVAPALPPPPPSLRGTDVDGDLELDARGHFVATPAARLLFDYFLAATGEEPAETIRSRVVAEARRRLPAPEAEVAIALFDRYVARRERGEDFTF